MGKALATLVKEALASVPKPDTYQYVAKSGRTSAWLKLRPNDFLLLQGSFVTVYARNTETREIREITDYDHEDTKSRARAEISRRKAIASAEIFERARRHAVKFEREAARNCREDWELAP